jgi:hypothetical protein
MNKQATPVTVQHVRLGKCLIAGFERINGVPMFKLLTLEVTPTVRVYVDAAQAAKVLIKGQV